MTLRKIPTKIQEQVLRFNPDVARTGDSGIRGLRDQVDLWVSDWRQRNPEAWKLVLAQTSLDEDTRQVMADEGFAESVEETLGEADRDHLDVEVSLPERWDEEPAENLRTYVDLRRQVGTVPVKTPAVETPEVAVSTYAQAASQGAPAKVDATTEKKVDAKKAETRAEIIQRRKQERRPGKRERARARARAPLACDGWIAAPVEVGATGVSGVATSDEDSDGDLPPLSASGLEAFRREGVPILPGQDRGHGKGEPVVPVLPPDRARGNDGVGRRQQVSLGAVRSGICWGKVVGRIIAAVMSTVWFLIGVVTWPLRIAHRFAAWLLWWLVGCVWETIPDVFSPADIVLAERLIAQQKLADQTLDHDVLRASLRSAVQNLQVRTGKSYDHCDRLIRVVWLRVAKSRRNGDAFIRRLTYPHRLRRWCLRFVLCAMLVGFAYSAAVWITPVLVYGYGLTDASRDLKAGFSVLFASAAVALRREGPVKWPSWEPPLNAEGNIDSSLVELPVERGAYRLPVVVADTTCLGLGDKGNLGPHCRLLSEEEPGECLSKPGVGATLMGWTTHFGYVLRKCFCNAHNALCNRHGVKQVMPTRDLFEVFESFAYLFRWSEGVYDAEPMRDRDAWMAKWPEGKRNAIRASQMVDDVMADRVKVMVKREVSHKVPSKARLIQYYVNLATQAEFGPCFYALQKLMCATFRQAELPGGIDVTFASGMRADEIGIWMRQVVNRGAVLFYERDGKCWDASMQEMHAKFRQDLYSIVDSELASFARAGNKVRGFGLMSGLTFRYRVDYTVKSGHNDTTLGNSIINAAISYATLKHLGLRGSIIVAGDDALVALYDPGSLEQLIQVEASYGIVPEARLWDKFWQTSFISGIFMPVGDDIRFVPQPGRLFARLWWTVKPPSARKREMYLRGVARGLLPVAGGMPLVGTLLSSFDTAGPEIPSDKGYTFRGSVYGPGDYTLAYALRYSLSEYEIELCEAWLKSLPNEPMLLRNDVLDRLVEVDLADIHDRGRGLW